MKVGTNVIVGGVAGAVDQVIQNQDEKQRRAKEAAGQQLPMYQEIGTYYNYVLPAIALIGVATGIIKGEWADKSILIGAQLAGRKATFQITKASQALPWRPYRPSAATPPAKQTTQPEFSGAQNRIY
jgi:hypothetical protein